MAKPKGVFVIDPQFFDSVYPVEQRRRIGRFVDIIPVALSGLTLSHARAELRTADFIFGGWGMPAIDEAFLAGAPALKTIFYAAGSVRRIMTDAAWERNIVIVTAAAANAIPVAEFCVSQILFCLKHGWQRALTVKKDHTFPPVSADLPGAFQSTVGLVSLGRIARLVRERLRPYDLEVIAWDPFVQPSEADALGVTLCPLDQVFSASDVVSLHSPLLPETRRMIDGSHFARMKHGASFINTSRGAVIDEEALISVLRVRPDLFAVLDVTSPEPPRSDSALYDLANVIVTPHMAGCQGRECRRMGQLVVDELERFLAGQPLQHALTREQVASNA